MTTYTAVAIWAVKEAWELHKERKKARKKKKEDLKNAGILKKHNIDLAQHNSQAEATAWDPDDKINQ